MTLTATGIYQDTEVDSRQDYFLGIQSRAGFAPSLNTLDFFAANGLPTCLAPPAPAFIQIVRAHVCTPVTNAPLVCRLLLDKPSSPSCPASLPRRSLNTIFHIRSFYS